MKKFFAVFAVAAALIFASCKTEWKTDFEQAKETAQKENKAIFLNITSFGTDSISEVLQKNVFENAKFGRKYSNKFVLVNLDFSERMKMTNLGADASEEDMLKMQKVLDETAPAMAVAKSYAVRDLPTTLILTPEGFVVRRLDFFEIKSDFDASAQNAENAKIEDMVNIFDFDKSCKAIDEVLPSLDEFSEKIKIADDENAEASSRVDAINFVFEKTDFAYQRLLRRLSEKAISLDPTNSSGKIAQHIVSVALSDDDGENSGTKVSKTYENAAEHPALNPEDRQFLYFQAATSFSRAQNDSDFVSEGGFDRIAELLNKSFDAAPESQFAPAIKDAIEDFKKWRARMTGEALPAQEAEEPSESEKSAEQQ